MKYFIKSSVLMLGLFILSACGGSSGGSGSPTPPPPGPAAITSYSLTAPGGNATSAGTIDQVHRTITVIFSTPTDLGSLIATFTTNGDVSVNGVAQKSGFTSNNFTNSATAPLQYLVKNSSSQNTYSVIAVVQSPDSKKILTYSLPGEVGEAQITSNAPNSTINITMPYYTTQTSLSNLIATFTQVGKSITVAGVPQVSGVTPNNFNNAITYIVTADDDSQNSYAVHITIESNPNNNSKYIPASTWPMQCIIGRTFAETHNSAKKCDGANLAGLSYPSGTSILTPILDLTGSTFRGANLTNAVLIYSVIKGVHFNNAAMIGTQLGGAGNTIDSTDFTGATMEDLTVIPGTNFTNDTFDGADLVGAAIGGSPTESNTVSSSTFNGSKFGAGTTFSYINFNAISFTPIIQSGGTTFSFDTFNGGVFDGSQSSESTPSVSFATDVFNGTQFTNFISPKQWTFPSSKLTNVTFNFGSNANPTNWSFPNAILDNVSFSPKFLTCQGFDLHRCTHQGGTACKCSEMCVTIGSCVSD